MLDKQLEAAEEAARIMADLAARMYASFGDNSGTHQERLAFANSVIGRPEITSVDKPGEVPDKEFAITFSLKSLIPNHPEYKDNIVEVEGRRRVERLIRMVTKMVAEQYPFYLKETNEEFPGSKRQFNEKFGPPFSGEIVTTELHSGGTSSHQGQPPYGYQGADFTIVTGNAQFLLPSILSLCCACNDLGALKEGTEISDLLSAGQNLRISKRVREQLPQELAEDLRGRHIDHNDILYRRSTVRGRLEEYAKEVQYFISAEPERLLTAAGPGFDETLLPDQADLQRLATPGRELLAGHRAREMDAIVALGHAAGLQNHQILLEMLNNGFELGDVVGAVTQYVACQLGVTPEAFLSALAKRFIVETGKTPAQLLQGLGDDLNIRIALPPERKLPPVGRQDIGGASTQKDD